VHPIRCGDAFGRRENRRTGPSSAPILRERGLAPTR
jgi:hypothetical protein